MQTSSSIVESAPPPKIGPDDPRYRAVLDKQFNKRFRASPDHVYLADSTAAVAGALGQAVAEARRITVTSGGHGLEGFVSQPDVQVVIDVAPMKSIEFDPKRNAIVVESGATVGDTFRTLAERWGVVLPLGEYPGVGIGGHVLGGAFGFLCRQLGLAADYLYGIEVVTVDDDGRTRVTIATRDDAGELHELWWAHTGGGGGNFGIVTRYWFRAHDATGNNPRELLPRAPESIATLRAEWSWTDFDERVFVGLMRNHGRWHEHNSAPGDAESSLWSLLELHRKQFGTLVVRGVSTAGARAAQQFDAYLDALCDGIPAAQHRDVQRLSWLEFALNPLPDLFGGGPPGGVSTKIKDAIVKRPFTDAQASVIFRHLTRTDVDLPGVMFGMASYGGHVNARPTDATAAPQRAGILDVACNAGWVDPNDAEANIAWTRTLYHELFRETGGVPVPGDAYDGALINHPDVDLADPAWNTSGTPWSAIYYQANYARLQRVKARWDPRDIFRHPLSIRPL